MKTKSNIILYLMGKMLKTGETLRPHIADLPTGLSALHPAAWLATWFYSGLLRPASGSWGSLAALPFALILYELNLPYQQHLTAAIIAIAILFILGIWGSGRYAKAQASDDPASVVIDEVVGMWIALLFTPFTVGWWIVAFLAFRLFDIVKPPPANWIDRNMHGGFGIMLDDVVAGVYAGVLIWALMAIKQFVGY